jgi:hypothetical protein
LLEPAVEFLFATVACRRFDALLVLVLVDGGVVPPPPRFLIDVNHAVAASASPQLSEQRQNAGVERVLRRKSTQRCARHLLNPNHR